jgi:RHS repeat-associated protein
VSSFRWVAPEFIPAGEAQEANASFSHQPMIDQLLANELVDGGAYWPLTDHLGTVRDLVTFNGTTTTNVEHRVFDSFGNLVSDNNSTLSDTFSFTGRFFDVDTKLQWNLNRWYDPFLGQWVSEDPIGFAGGDENLRRYVGNGVVNRVDPSGLFGSGAGTSYPGPNTLSLADHIRIAHDNLSEVAQEWGNKGWDLAQELLMVFLGKNPDPGMVYDVSGWAPKIEPWIRNPIQSKLDQLAQQKGPGNHNLNYVSLKYINGKSTLGNPLLDINLNSGIDERFAGEFEEGFWAFHGIRIGLVGKLQVICGEEVAGENRLIWGFNGTVNIQDKYTFPSWVAGGLYPDSYGSARTLEANGYHPFWVSGSWKFSATGQVNMFAS